MAYKTVVVLVSESESAESCIEAAATIAKMEESHLIGVAITGVTRFLKETVTLDKDNPGIAPFLDVLRKRAGKLLEKFNKIVETIGVKSVETRALDNPFSRDAGLLGTCCDLLVLGQSDPSDSNSIESEITADLLTGSAYPVLMMPYKESFKKVGSHVLIAWDGSRESQRAIRDAIPFLQKAENVHLVTFSHGLQAEDLHRQSLADIQAYLMRYGVRVDVSERATNSDVGDALLMLISSTRSNLLVMGCYGHSPFREMVFGGVTRKILKTMNAPVLLSH
ncbi:universal stress protein [Herbaspirillum sp. RV1423]|uniref:universal stress protein n=1 Tax=Herbaspirillum sp. RV1423 TaxID=1443993 RepID=UPI0004AF97E7|nr:universal stress protein [Herbaspirillum sp. RV1423]